jgi:hypothetical protein
MNGLQIDTQAAGAEKFVTDISRDCSSLVLDFNDSSSITKDLKLNQSILVAENTTSINFKYQFTDGGTRDYKNPTDLASFGYDYWDIITFDYSSTNQIPAVPCDAPTGMQWKVEIRLMGDINLESTAPVTAGDSITPAMVMYVFQPSVDGANVYTSGNQYFHPIRNTDYQGTNVAGTAINKLLHAFEFWAHGTPNQNVADGPTPWNVRCRMACPTGFVEPGSNSYAMAGTAITIGRLHSQIRLRLDTI